MERTIENQTACLRCGECCNKGGPSLHEPDLALIKEQHLKLTDLTTIRKGEPVVSPLTDNTEPSQTELIKLSGQGDKWQCKFYAQATNQCEFYTHRPLECQLLKCWAPSSLTNIIYKHCLSRRDVVPNNDNLWELIELQEEHCSFAQVEQLAADFTKKTDPNCLKEIARIVNLDLKIRQRAIQMRQLSVAEELLYFGRPLFKSLGFYDLAVKESHIGLTITPTASFGT